MKLGKTNGKYRDRLFKFIFGNPDNREWTLELYNAVNGSNYDNPDDIMYNIIDDAIYMNMKNDVSFIIEDTMSLYEQQSTYCPNMPLRFLMYLAKLYEGYSQREKFYIYSSTLQRIPKPKCVCFYNGKNKKEDRKILRLSDMYFENTKSEKDIEGIVELEVIMININYGHNKDLLERCTPLYEYSFFVDKVRLYLDNFEKDEKNYTLEDAIDKAIEELPKDFKILQFILKNRVEVKDMCLFEYDQEKHIRGERADAEAKGRAEGREEIILKLIKDNIISIEEGAKQLVISVEELEKKLREFTDNK